MLRQRASETLIINLKLVMWPLVRPKKLSVANAVIWYLLLGASSLPDEVIVVSPHEEIQPLNISTEGSFFPSPPPSPRFNPSSPLERILVSPRRKRSPPHPTRDGKRSSPMLYGLVEPVSYTTSVPKQYNSPLTQDNGNPLTATQQSKYESSLFPGEELNEKTALAINSVFKSTAEPSLWTCGPSPLNSSFPQMSMIQKLVSTQAPQNPYQCGHCPASFTNVNHLRMHAVTHASKKPFKCGVCSRYFTRATTLNNHIRSHIGGRLFASGKRSSQG